MCNLITYGKVKDCEIDGPTGRYIRGLALQLMMSVRDGKKLFGRMDTHREDSLK